MQTIDGVAPTSTLTSQRLSPTSGDYNVKWSALDDVAGSGVKHVTVYVAEDGGDFRIWLKQSSETAAVYQGTAGHQYEFLALATDQAGNRELPPATLQVPDDGSRADLGALPNVPETTQPSAGNAPAASQDPPANPIFKNALLGVPSPV